MIIVTVTTYGFNPINEYEAMQGFEAANDMKEWQKSEGTQLVCYTHTERTVTTLPDLKLKSNKDK